MDETIDEFDMLDEEEKKGRSPFIYIIAVFLILLLILMIYPAYNVKIDPRPDIIPTIDEVMIQGANLSQETRMLKTQDDFLNFVVPQDPFVKTVAGRIVSPGCGGEQVCHAKAIYYFVRDKFDYIADPVNFEYVEMSQDFLASGGGDCESGTLFMANMMEAVGIHTQLVFVPGHAFLRIMLPEALSRYKADGNWVYLDWTCKDCSFGEIPRNIVDMKKSFLDIS